MTRYNTSRSIPSQSFLKEMFDYDPTSGFLTFKRRIEVTLRDKTWNERHAGKRAGSATKASSRVVIIDRIIYQEARLIYILNYGIVPTAIFHINGNASDNSLVNLRVGRFRKKPKAAVKTCLNREGYETFRVGSRR